MPSAPDLTQLEARLAYLEAIFAAAAAGGEGDCTRSRPEGCEVSLVDRGGYSSEQRGWKHGDQRVDASRGEEGGALKGLAATTEGTMLP